MILPDYMIRERRLPLYGGEDRPMVVPFVERQVHETGLSFGLSHAGYDVRIKQNRTLTQGEFCLASTVEHFVIPNDVMAFVLDKSTLARQGISLLNTCLEPGWSGYLTLEIVCHARGPVVLRAGQPIAQIVFQQMLAPPERTYAGGKYDNQPDEPVSAIREAV
jgi:dCTP deaminase